MLAPPVEIEELRYSYPGSQRPALDGVSLSVGSGEILGVLGTNGAGKTTTLQLLLGLLEPGGGRVRVFGEDPLAHRERVLPRLNFASADVDLPSNLTVDECLFVFSGLYGVSGQANDLLERFHLTPLRRQLVGSLSSGEQMRLKLVKALLNDPQLLVLDEPTRSLDPYMAQRVRELLRSIQREHELTVIHTSHNMHEVETFCDRIVFLHRGRLLAEGKPLQVMSRFGSDSLSELFIRVAASGELVQVDGSR